MDRSTAYWVCLAFNTSLIHDLVPSQGMDLVFHHEGGMTMDWKTLAAQALKGTMDWAKTAGDFAKVQVPDVARQLLTFRMIEAGVLCAVDALGCLVAVVIMVRLVRWGLRELKKNNEAGMAGIIPSIFLALPVCFFGQDALQNLRTMLMIHYAPKVYLIQAVAELLQK